MPHAAYSIALLSRSKAIAQMNRFIGCGGCLCGETSYRVDATVIHPHLCSCKMCQKSSGAPTVAWVEFSLVGFEWIGNPPRYYRSSPSTQRCSCRLCGGLLATFNEGYPNVCITIASLDNPNAIQPQAQHHSYLSSAPSWWHCDVLQR